MFRKTVAVLAGVAAIGVLAYIASRPGEDGASSNGSASEQAPFTAVGGNWQPGDGVREAVAAPMIAWLAVASVIDVDAAYERELGEEAARILPIRIALLNNSYEPFAFQGSVEDPLWQVTLRSGSAGTIHEWAGGAAAEEFGPAERREVVIPWDGRDGDGLLVPPGSYDIHFTSASLADGRRLEADAHVEIRDTR